MANLSEILDVEIPLPKAPDANTVVLVPDVSMNANNTVAQDAQDARTNVRLMIAQGTQAVTELLTLARDLKTPRAYEVAANMLKTLAELSQDLLAVHQQEMSLVEPEAPVAGDVNIETAVFLGSTADLQEMIRIKRDEKRLRTIEAKVISTDNV
jgi:hypothetical protein